MLIITTPNAQHDGNARMDSYIFAGKNGRKFFSIQNTSPGIVALNISLALIGGTGSFRLFPADISSTDQTLISLFLNPNDIASFSVDYDSSLGNATGAILTTDSDIYDPTGAIVVIGATTPITFGLTDNLSLTKREIGSLLSKDEDGNYLVEQSSSKISEDTSFGLVRTNPLLTGNVMITVDFNGDIWLNSINATKDLSDDKYKKFRIGKNGSYPSDVCAFFDNGETAPESVFALYQNDPLYTSTKRTTSDQYDRFYQYGVTEQSNKLYTENFSFFAPIYLKKDIPDYFVIFRTDGSVNKFSYDLPFDQWSSEVTSQILSSSKIVKVFSLSQDSLIGSYLRNLVNHPSRTDADLSISYQTNGFTTYNGIAYDKGSFAQRGELLNDTYFNQENPLSVVEEFVTQGFQRNKILSSHVINLEFLFNDDEAANYSINRYFGLYVNAIDLAKFTISDGGLQAFSLSDGQLPLPRKGIDGNKLSQKSFTQTNSSGIKVYADSSTITRTGNIDLAKSFTSIVDSVTYDSTYIYVSLEGNFEYKIENDDIFTFSSNTGFTATAQVYSFSYTDNYTAVVFDIARFSSSVTLSYFASNIASWTCNFYTPEKAHYFTEDVFRNSFVENSPRFFYLKDNKKNLHSVISTQQRFYNTDPFTSVETMELTLGDTSLDMSLLGGFSNILTQVLGVPLNTKGRSSMTVEITDFFSPNDYMEIAWSGGPTNDGYPLRWRVVANSTGTNPGEAWPTSSLTSDIDGQYYLAYFNPGNSTVTLETFVKSIQQAFDTFQFRDFEVLAKGTKLHFRSTQEGRVSESEYISFYNASPALKIMGVQASNSGQVSFVGGSDRFRTRAKIDNTVAHGILIDEYISTKGGFSLPRAFDVLGEKIVFAPYLEEPVYDSEEKLIDFLNSDLYEVLCLDDESHPIQLTSDKKITSYEIFKPSFGVLSVMPLRDFDTDFFLSDYVKSYLPELVQYFGRYAPPGKVLSVTGSIGSQVCTFDQTYSFDSYPTTVPYLTIYTDGSSPAELHRRDIQLRFDVQGATAMILQGPSTTATPAVGDTLLLMPGEKSMYFSDSELSKFKGFFSITGVISSQDEENFKALENQWDPSRFGFHLLNSEYDRLSENNLKTLVLKSRVVPYITKWVHPLGKDIRDNDYRFNYHRSFGIMGFSPSSTMQDPDPRYHTQEWPYLDSVPDSYPIAKFPTYAFSYMFDPLGTVYDFSSLKRDWFSAYFTTGYPTELYENNGSYYPALLEPAERYSIFNYQDYNDTTVTLFRGYKLTVKELDSNGLPVNLSTKYDGYKFSSIIETVEDDTKINETPIIFTTIVNEKWKFILLKITVRVSSYRFTEGRLRYVDLYTLDNNDETASYTYDPSLSSTLSTYNEAVPTDRKISQPINLSSYSADSSLVSNYQYYDTFYSSTDTYTEDLTEEVVPLQDGSFYNIAATNENGVFRVLATAPAPYNIYSRRTLKLGGTSASAKISGGASIINYAIPFTAFSWRNFSFYHMSGGNGSFAGMRERLSFSEILSVIKGTSSKSKMIYEIYKADGTVLNSPNFVMDSIDPVSLTRTTDYYPVNDTDKPQIFYNAPVIGAVLEQQQDLQTLYRYQGDFVPKFKDVLKFQVREDEDFVNVTSQDFLLSNTHLATNLSNFATLTNQYYFKVSDSEVLRLSPSGAYQPVYPLINEIAIDKKDVFAWSSSWDQNYYRKYSSTSDFVELEGTSEMQEVKSLLGSKAMKVPKQFSLYEFGIFESPSSNLSQYSNDEFVYYESSTTAYLQVNVYNRLLREMLGTSTDTRAKTEFLRVMNLIPGTFDPAQLDNYVKQYLKDNIMKLYSITEAKLYVLQTGNPGAGTIATVTPSSQHRPLIEFTTDSLGNEVTLSEAELLNRGYVLQKNTKINNVGDLIFQITFPLDSRYFTSLSIGVNVERS